jgi:hypothetical protein
MWMVLLIVCANVLLPPTPFFSRFVRLGRITAPLVVWPICKRDLACRFNRPDFAYPFFFTQDVDRGLDVIAHN